jgi:hypothetical protein
MTAAFFRRGVFIGAFLDHLQLQTAVPTDVNLPFFHLMTIRHD